jgi:soluble lytic murein transglycosylase
MKLLNSLIIILVLLVGVAQAEEINIDAIIQIESSENPLAYNRLSDARGLMQITPCVLYEYNRLCKTNYSAHNLYNPAINKQVGIWYLSVRIPQLLRHYHKPITITNLIKSYNAGIRSVVEGYTPRETAAYLKKYARLTNK